MATASTNVRAAASFSIYATLVAPIVNHIAQIKTFNALNKLDDAMLKDVGLTRDELWDVAKHSA